jgi:putative endopeptidase
MVLVNNVQKAYAVRIDKLEWMSTTKKSERETVLSQEIGYPDKWKDYSNVRNS